MVVTSGALAACRTSPGWPVPAPSSSASIRSQWCIRMVTSLAPAGMRAGSVVTKTTGAGSVPRAAATRVPAGIGMVVEVSVLVRAKVTAVHAAAGGCRVTPSRLRKETYAFSGTRFSR